MAVVHKGHLGDHEKKIDYWIINQGAWEPGRGTSSFPSNINHGCHSLGATQVPFCC